jgi:hypothetical protein
MSTSGYQAPGPLLTEDAISPPHSLWDQLTAARAIKWLVGYLNKHGLAVFGWYRLVLAAVIAILVFGTGTVRIEPRAESIDVPPPRALME